MTHALDTESGPFPMPPGSVGAWALEPYRPEFYTKMVCITSPGRRNRPVHMDSDNFTNDVLSEIESVVGKEVVCHNAIFDIAVLIRTLGDIPIIGKIKWRDTGLLAKWLNNSQKDEYMSYSLRNCVEKWLPDHPETEEFLAMKDNVEDDYHYWLNRVVKDCLLTADLHDELVRLLPPEQMRGYIIECKCLYPLARGWMKGIKVNHDVVEETRIKYQSAANKILRDIGTSEKTLRSSKRLGELIYGVWGLEPISFTGTGAPSTKADDLKYIALNTGDDRLTKLVEAKQALTVISKYVKGFNSAKSYLGNDTIHPSPRLFNSYTGRMTYNSKLFKKHQVGIALHQLPRKAKEVKRAMVAPDGYQFLYMDFAAQELRIMAQFSNDEVMIKSFNDGLDLHSTMTERIYGTSYETIVAGNVDGIPEIVDQRNCGKLTNLSSMYRIGAKSLQAKFFGQYDKVINIREATHFLNSYKKTFRGIPKYWDDAIKFARANKYASSLSHRRFYLKADDWKGESSAINMPIQASGADLSELAIALIAEKFPQMIFTIQVHDSMTWAIPDSMDPRIVKEFIDNIDWNVYFDATLRLDFPLDMAYGPNLADMETL